MKKILTRFGEIEYKQENLLIFPEGLIGLSHLKNFLVMPNEKQGPLFWIQSVDDPTYAVVVTNPQDFFPDYAITLSKDEREKIGLKQDEEYFTLAIVSITQKQEITLNLAGPLFYAPSSNQGIQIILENPKYSTKTPLPKTE